VTCWNGHAPATGSHTQAEPVIVGPILYNVQHWPTADCTIMTRADAMQPTFKYLLVVNLRYLLIFNFLSA